MVLYGDWVGISGVALWGYIHSSPFTFPTPDTPTQPTHSYSQSQSHTPTIYPIHHSPNQPSSLPPLYAKHTLSPPYQTHSHTSTQLIYPIIHTPHIIVPSKPSPLLPLYAHSAAKTRISPSEAHMALGRFCCALTIGCKCKTSNINKRL